MRKRNEEFKETVYKFINDYIVENGVSPTYDTIASSLHRAKSTIFIYMKRLEEEGYISIHENNQIVTRENLRKVDKIPIIGTVACGSPKLAVEDIKGYLPISIDLLGSGKYFALETKGDSMINVSINSGDIVIVRKQETAENGQIVVAMVEDESGEYNATLKRFYKEKKRIRLHPENDEMDDIICSEATILGVAVKVIKNLI